MNAFTELIEDYVRHIQSLNFSRWMAKQSRNDLLAFARWLSRTVGVDAPVQLRSSHVERWQLHLSEHRTRKGLPLHPRTINKHVQELRAFLKYAARHGHVTMGLMEAAQYVKEPSLLPGSVLTHEEARRLLDRLPAHSAEAYRNRAMLELAYSSGVRAAELLGLNVTDLDFANAVALVRGKGQKERMVPIGRTALHALEGYVKAVRPHWAVGAEPALFLTAAGKRVTYPSLLRLVHAVAGTAGLPKNVTPHTFRRACTTELLRAGAGMYHVKELLGHESLETLKHYAMLTIRDLKEAHAKFHPRERDPGRAV